jgi:hypothetical protein
MLHPEDGGSMDLWNVDTLPRHYTTSQPRRRRLETSLWKPQNSPNRFCVGVFAGQLNFGSCWLGVTPNLHWDSANFMQQIASWEAKSRSTGQEILRLLWNSVHWTLSRARWVQSTPFHPLSLNISSTSRYTKLKFDVNRFSQKRLTAQAIDMLHGKVYPKIFGLVTWS